MKYYFKLILRQLPLLLLDIFCLIVDVILEMMQPFIMAAVLDNGVKKGDFNYCLIACSILLGMTLLAVLFSIISMSCSVKIANRFCQDLRKDLFHKVQSLSSTSLEKYGVPTLLTRITLDVNVIRKMMTLLTRAGLKVPLMLIVGSSFMFIYNVKLALIVLSVCIVLFVSIILTIILASPRFKKSQVALDDINKILEEDINGIRTVKSFVREKYEITDFKNVNDEFMVLNRKAHQLASLNTPLILFGANICTALILWIGGIDVINVESFTTGKLASFINFTTIVLMSFNMISGIAINMAHSYACFLRINEVFNESDDESLKSFDSNNELSVDEGSIEFENVTYSYSNDKNKIALGPISFSIKSKEIIGIVGSTGSGKSTLISLLPRLYDSSSGSIKISNNDIKDYDVRTLRNNIGLVTQKSVLFSKSIRENLLFGNDNVTDKEIDEALKIASCDFVYSFKDGLDTKLSWGGLNVSGGQRQRLCIARALIKKPKILILDDSLSAVDSETEEKIKNSIYENKNDMTVIIISQKISSVKNADRIIVLNNGLIESIDTHEELLKKSSVYKEMYESQKRLSDYE